MTEETVAVPVEMAKTIVNCLRANCHDGLANRVEALLPKPRSARAMLEEQIRRFDLGSRGREERLTILAKLDAERENLRKCLMSICDCGECATIRAWLEETK